MALVKYKRNNKAIENDLCMEVLTNACPSEDLLSLYYYMICRWTETEIKMIILYWQVWPRLTDTNLTRVVFL